MFVRFKKENFKQITCFENSKYFKGIKSRVCLEKDSLLRPFLIKFKWAVLFLWFLSHVFKYKERKELTVKLKYQI